MKVRQRGCRRLVARLQARSGQPTVWQNIVVVLSAANYVCKTGRAAIYDAYFGDNWLNISKYPFN